MNAITTDINKLAVLNKKTTFTKYHSGAERQAVSGVLQQVEVGAFKISFRNN